MGDKNQLNFVLNNINIVQEPILEVGSRDYGNTPDFRSMFPGYEYVSVDMQEGKGVDLVIDLTDDLNTIREDLGKKRFKTIICFSVLEHCRDPFKMCRNIMQLLETNGVVFISVPFSWRIHGYPSDYWRFTPEGIKVLFPDLDFDTYPGNISTSRIGECKPIDDYMFQKELAVPKGIKLKRYGYFIGGVIFICRKLAVFPSIFGYHNLFPPVMVNMIGLKK